MTISARDPLRHWHGPMGLPEFEFIDDGAYAAGFDSALAAHEREIETIAGNTSQ